MQQLGGREWRAMRVADSLVPISTVKKLGVVGKGAPQLIHTLLRTTNQFESAKVSPSNEFICLVDKDQNLHLSSTEPGQNGFREIGRNFGDMPDWDVNTDVIYGLHAVSKKKKTGERNYQELVSYRRQKTYNDETLTSPFPQSLIKKFVPL